MRDCPLEVSLPRNTSPTESVTPAGRGFVLLRMRSRRFPAENLDAQL